MWIIIAALLVNCLSVWFAAERIWKQEYNQMTIILLVASSLVIGMCLAWLNDADDKSNHEF